MREREGNMTCSECGHKTKKTKGDYEYKESGLDNVILKNITIHKCPKCKEIMPEIPNIERLHKAIAYAIAKEPSPLTGAGIKFLRLQLGMKAKDFAAMMGVTDVTVSRWERGATPIGETSDRLVRLYLIQSLEESCNRVLKSSTEAIRAVTKEAPRRRAPIEITEKLRQNVCFA